VGRLYSNSSSAHHRLPWRLEVPSMSASSFDNPAVSNSSRVIARPGSPPETRAPGGCIRLELVARLVEGNKPRPPRTCRTERANEEDDPDIRLRALLRQRCSNKMSAEFDCPSGRLAWRYRCAAATSCLRIGYSPRRLYGLTQSLQGRQLLPLAELA